MCSWKRQSKLKLFCLFLLLEFHQELTWILKKVKFKELHLLKKHDVYR